MKILVDTEKPFAIAAVSQIRQATESVFKDLIYLKRRNQLRKDVCQGIILLPGNDESPMIPSYTNNN